MRLLDANKIDHRHLMQWKLIGDAQHLVSLPEHPHQTNWIEHRRRLFFTPYYLGLSRVQWFGARWLRWCPTLSTSRAINTSNKSSGILLLLACQRLPSMSSLAAQLLCPIGKAGLKSELHHGHIGHCRHIRHWTAVAVSIAMIMKSHYSFCVEQAHVLDAECINSSHFMLMTMHF